MAIFMKSKLWKEIPLSWAIQNRFFPLSPHRSVRFYDCHQFWSGSSPFSLLGTPYLLVDCLLWWNMENKQMTYNLFLLMWKRELKSPLRACTPASWVHPFGIWSWESWEARAVLLLYVATLAWVYLSPSCTRRPGDTTLSTALPARMRGWGMQAQGPSVFFGG